MPEANRNSEEMSRMQAVPGAPEEMLRKRTSEILRGILTDNPDVKSFSVKRILSAIGEDRFDASMLMFSIPAIIPVPKPTGVATTPTGVIAGQLVCGYRKIELPSFILRKQVSRKSLAVAIHAVLPLLEAAEKVMRPRWSWVNESMSRRALGVLVFLLALAGAYPLFGFNAFHASSIFVISLGMAERDGIAVLVGVVAGVLSLAMLGTSGVSARAVRSKVIQSLRKILRKLGIQALADYLSRRGYTRVASLLTFEWSTLLWIWDPENTPRPDAKHAAERKAGGKARRARLAAQSGAERLSSARLFSAAAASLSSSRARLA